MGALAAAGGAGLLFAVMGSNAGTPEPAKAAPAPAPGASAAPAVPAALDASGYVVAARQATVSADTTGRLAAVLVQEGARVRKGDIIARLDTRDLDQQVALAQAQLATAIDAREQRQVELDAARDRYQRIARLWEQRFSSEADYRAAAFTVERLRAARAMGESEIAVAQRRLEMAQQLRRNSLIVAPFDGIVANLAAQVGEIVSPMSGGGFTRTGICTIVDIGSLEVRVQINEKYISRISPGQAVDITPRAYPGLRLPGTVVTIMPAASRETGAIEVIARFDRTDERVLPNMSVDVAFASRPDAPAAAAGRG
jgi:RND family efflux transporter MFP subunit